MAVALHLPGRHLAWIAGGQEPPKPGFGAGHTPTRSPQPEERAQPGKQVLLQMGPARRRRVEWLGALACILSQPLGHDAGERLGELRPALQDWRDCREIGGAKPKGVLSSPFSR